MAITEGSIFSGFPAIASPLGQFIVQLVIILGFIRLIALLLRPLRQPTVIAEVIAGILVRQWRAAPRNNTCLVQDLHAWRKFGAH